MYKVIKMDKILPGNIKRFSEKVVKVQTIPDGESVRYAKRKICNNKLYIITKTLPLFNKIKCFLLRTYLSN